MTFKKGISGNPEGRPKGSQNKTTPQLRMLINKLVEDQFECFIKDIKELKAKERVTIFLKLLEFVLPKQRYVEQQLDIHKLAKDEIDSLFEYAKSKMNANEP